MNIYSFDLYTSLESQIKLLNECFLINKIKHEFNLEFQSKILPKDECEKIINKTKHVLNWTVRQNQKSFSQKEIELIESGHIPAFTVENSLQKILFEIVENIIETAQQQSFNAKYITLMLPDNGLFSWTDDTNIKYLQCKVVYVITSEVLSVANLSC